MVPMSSDRRVATIAEIVALVLFAAYLGTWISGRWELLVEPAVQNNDARGVLFPFHRYAPEGALAGDPIADEMLTHVTPGVSFLYRVLVPAFGVLGAAKVVQALGFALIGLAGLILARTHGIGAGVLLVFFFFHQGYAVARIASGLPRAFAFPCFALWIAGALCDRTGPRRFAAVLAAFTYPSAMALLVVAEGVFEVLGLRGLDRRALFRRASGYVALVAVCFVLVLPFAVSEDPDRGPIHTLEEARRDPAFGPAGRLKVLPFPDPVAAFGRAVSSPLRPQGRLSALGEALAPHQMILAAIGLAVCGLVLWRRWSPFPRAALALLVGAIVSYGVARVLAFRLYSPVRFHDYGGQAAGLALVVSCLGLVGYRQLAPERRRFARGVAASAAIVWVWLLLGDGVFSAGVVDARGSKMLAFVSELPKDALIASHPMDGDGIPLFAARATMGSYETLQPWFKGEWALQRRRTSRTLGALYAKDCEQVLAYAQGSGVTHFLIAKRRYDGNVMREARSFEPFDSHVRRLLTGRSRRDLFFRSPPPASIVFEGEGFRIVEVRKLSC